MKSMLRLSLLWALFAFFATAAMGCVVTVEPAVTYEGTPVDKTVAYASGQNILVRTTNGTIDVVPGSSATEIQVTFEPFSIRAGDEEELAQSDMEDDLHMVVDETVDPIEIRAYRDEGSSGSLGAHIRVELPSGFDGGIEIETKNGGIEANLTGGLPTYTTVIGGNGGVDVRGAAGNIDIDIDNGSSSVSVQAWSAADGRVHCGNGSLDFTVASGLSGNLTAVSDGPEAVVVDPSPLPTDWVPSAENVDNSKRFAFGADAATMGTVALTTGNGDIVLDVN